MNHIEDNKIFEKRKQDHIKWSLDSRSQLQGPPSSFLELIHEALPEINFNDVELQGVSKFCQKSKPLLVSSMTGGHGSAKDINRILMKSCAEKKWIFSTGSLRKELENFKKNSSILEDWLELRSSCPEVSFIGNIGLAQVTAASLEDLASLSNKLNLDGLFVHLNPLQEVLQEEGTPHFKGGVEALKKIAQLDIPVFVKETGSGISERTFLKLKNIGLSAIDVAGLGGTHWGRVEGLRASEKSLKSDAALTFKNWGISTVESLMAGIEAMKGASEEIWASGGLRSGLDAAICFALGAKVCGYAKPFMEAALKGEDDVKNLMDLIEFEINTALFCTGHKNIESLSNDKEVLSWI